MTNVDTAVDGPATEQTRTWYRFAPGQVDGDRDMRALLGGKGANLAEMCRLGVPVPPGFTLPTTRCLAFFDDGERFDDITLAALEDGVAFIESVSDGARFGDRARPLLVSVRSGARDSMPGMMDSVLNLGLNEDTVAGLAEWSGDRRFALDAYRRLIQMFGDVVRGIDRDALEGPLTRSRERLGVQYDHELPAEELEEVVGEILGVYEKEAGEAFPHDPLEQLRQASAAVFASWWGKRAQTYRSLNGIPDSWGTAANVQAMVFGNLGKDSATGVAFSRNPSTGERRPMGEWLPSAQGEDVVAGIRTPGPLSSYESTGQGDIAPLEESMPEVYTELLAVMERLERHYLDLQDVEFTVQEGRLRILQTRSGKRTAAAAVRVAVEMVREGMIDERTAVARVAADQIDQLLHPQIDPEAPRELLARGLPASPGAASGYIVLDAEEAERLGKAGVAVILVRKETSPEDIAGMHAARGVLTQTGGMTSHAAVVARGMGRTCVAGCKALSVDLENGIVRIDTPDGERVLEKGSEITLDGSRGEVYLGAIPTVAVEPGEDFETLMQWADEIRTLGVRANADTPEDAALAVRLGAEGIGLCRTEHMFFAPERILAVREMILAADDEERRRALDKIEPMQRSDFVGILEAMAGKPVTVRFLDPPLHEFLPHTRREDEEIARDLGIEVETVVRKIEALREINPMLGHRGCRLGITFPEIYATQARALLRAACEVAARGIEVEPEIMIPLVMDPEELRRIRALVMEVAEEVFAETGRRVPFLVGTMIELPRAALLADEIAVHADFFSYGTNDLTQMTMGLSRDDAGRFLPSYVEQKILPVDPFQHLDQRGVGQLIEIGCRLGREARPDLKIGVCGEQGGDPESIAFFHRAGIDYVSCSPYRVPVARLAAAQAALEAEAEAGADADRIEVE